MVTADNLNLDCLELIFAHLHGNDLVSVSLVSRSFLAGVIPRLYRTLSFKLNQAKRYPKILSPFASVLAHPGLASHVRRIDIRTIPSVKMLPLPAFLRDCAQTIAICQNLVSFTCTPNVLPSFLLDLQDKESLQHLRVNASLTHDQAEMLLKIRCLKSITLDTGTPYVVDLLPRWTAALKSTLTTLTLYSMHDLNEVILGSVLEELPTLTGLHVIGCSKIDHNAILRRTMHTPRLESLSFTSWASESVRAPPAYVHPLRHLKHLAIDTHYVLPPDSSVPSLWTTMITLIRSWSSPLTSITLKLSDKITVDNSFIQELLDAHDASLTHIAMFNCGLTLESVRSICTRCTDLERIAVGIPVKDIYSFAEALSRSKTIQTLSDVGGGHTKHGQKPIVSRADVEAIMKLVPSLRRIIAENRLWTAQRTSGTLKHVQLERKRSPQSPHWFMPPS